MNAATASVAPARIDALDGLRALAMTAVVAQHCHLLPFGWTGVWLFFLISGYVITLGFDAGEYAGRGAAERFGTFIARRAARIVPAYLLYLAACTLVALALGNPAPLSNLPYLLSFTFNWHMIVGFWPGHVDWAPFGHLWTLSVEQQFYLLFPLLVLLVPVRMQTATMLALVVAGPLMRWLAARWLASAGAPPDAMAFAIYAATPCHLDAFLIGALVARLQPWWRARGGVVTALTLAGVVVPLAYAAAYVAINRQLGMQGIDQLRNVFSGVLYGQGREVLVYVAVDLAALAALLLALRQARGFRWLGWPPLAWVGRVSYGGYLFHALVVWGLAQWLGLAVRPLPLAQRLAFFVVAWAVTVLLAGLSYRFIERPIARRWRASGRHRAAASLHAAPTGA
ncbi:MAG TPA: acyltransferase [Burkholderiaceae bacterium]|nr:acyltransferase [Burkholderiaceae bacterium]